MYFKTDNWNVELYGFRDVSEMTTDRLLAEYPSRFRSFYMYFSRSIKDLLKERENQCFVFMDLDCITDTLFQSEVLYKKIPGATSARDIQVNFSALTKIVCGDSLQVVRQVATYASTSRLLARKLADLNWEVRKQSPMVMMPALLEMLEDLASSTAPTAQEPKTLVLVMGDKGLSVIDRLMWSRLLEEFAAKQWHIEIFSWMEMLSDDFLGAYIDQRQRGTVYALDYTLPDFAYLKQEEPFGNNTADDADIVDVPSLQQQIHQVQVAFVAMQADSATVRTQYQQDVDAKLQQLQTSFELQHRKQRSEFDAEYKRLQEDFKIWLRDQWDDFPASRDKNEKKIERRLKENVEFIVSRRIAIVRGELQDAAEQHYDKFRDNTFNTKKDVEALSLRYQKLRDEQREELQKLFEQNHKKLKRDVISAVFWRIFIALVVLGLCQVYATKIKADKNAHMIAEQNQLEQPRTWTFVVSTITVISFLLWMVMRCLFH
ncbi:hypothetical protein GN958_ATG00151 [Phytophthora infestans]|uniref:Uncharacterized protein n=1 Tax=Phytophthora infestans TaxID=4787 RepID=A0A8S9VCP8_PHYIN|nr:hypothetical protein GN958_ATG00151 [Phytophthora infestans]